MELNKKGLARVGAMAAVLVASPSFAHHSFAMFDAQKTMTLDGTIKEFQWTNPHCWVQILVKSPSGDLIEWSLEGTSPNRFARSGWTRNSLKPGDKATVTFHPLKDGTAGGSMMTVSVNGKVIGDSPPPQ
jgi:hypothetical protein